MANDPFLGGDQVNAVPQVEITGRLAGLVATFDDGRGTDCDAEDTHLMLRAGHCDFVTNIYDESIHATVCRHHEQNNNLALQASFLLPRHGRACTCTAASSIIGIGVQLYLFRF